MNPIPRPEYPRPDFQRSCWLNLNGIWNFAFDDEDCGRSKQWYLQGTFDRSILVPFVYQSKSSGIHDTSYHPIQWYSRKFRTAVLDPESRQYLCFGAVDFRADIWINGQYIGHHSGGYTPFSFDFTDVLIFGEDNLLVVRSEDRVDCSQPRGKQYWKESNDRCWYTPSSGIWQTVWLEVRPVVHVTSLHITPDIDTSSARINISLSRQPRVHAECIIEIIKEKQLIQKIDFLMQAQSQELIIPIPEDDYIDETHYWSPESPTLYDIGISILHDKSTDHVISYFGMRKISIQNGIIMLNNKPLYQRLVLDQAYWEDTLLTAPTDEAYIKDIELIKAMGFNGVRLHQKIEDPRFYYWTDKLGLLVWAEMPSTYCFNSGASWNIINELRFFIERDRNHPSIICWVPLNESWGVRNIYANADQQKFAVAVYYLIKMLDSSRLVNTNDGWEQVTSDLCGIHDYIRDGERFTHIWKDLDTMLTGTTQGRMIYASNFSYENQPILVTEFGGIAFSSDIGGDNWGYSDSVDDESQFINRLKSLICAIREKREIQGFCYTQFTDIMQEVNGLLSIERKPKCALEKIKDIIQL
ncbi:MAG: glycoside hydrolase family 2 TIM barrel-domain containing protein [Sphaerochaeta sp.]|nr:glycoside hydrolase family 2 TIM barrel-domain containing protein [Sphaerochaeta sp.]